jgi:hypothetical protein
MRGLLLLLTLGIFLTSQAQYTERFQEEFFFGHMNNASTEAMGRADVAVGGKVFSMRYNPAGTGTINQREISLSTSGPFYVLRKSDYFYGGFAEKVNRKLCVSASVQQLAVGPTTFTTGIGSDKRLKLDKPKGTKFCLNASYEILSGLFLGANANQFRLKLFDEVNSYSSFYLDGGVLYRLSLDEAKSQFVQIGMSLMNINNSNMTLESPSGQTAGVNLPSIFRTGLAYHRKSPLNIKGAKPGNLELTFTAEIEAVRNFKYRTMKKVGVEAIVYDILSFRTGYISWNQNNMGFPTNLSTIENFTYGFGAIIPTSGWRQSKIPFDIIVDFTSMAQPPFTSNGRRIPNMRSFSTRLVWNKAKGGNND